MPFSHIKFGLFADAPDLLESMPFLGKLKKLCPDYLKNAEDAQKIARRFAKEDMLPKAIEIDKNAVKTHVILIGTCGKRQTI